MTNFLCVYPMLKGESCFLCSFYEKCVVKDELEKKNIECSNCGFEFDVYEDFTPRVCPVCLLAFDKAKDFEGVDTIIKEDYVDQNGQPCKPIESV